MRYEFVRLTIFDYEIWNYTVRFFLILHKL